MKLPRDIDGQRLVRILQRLGYRVTRSRGSHVRLTHPGPPQHHVTIPNHPVLKVGLLNAVVSSVSAHLKVERNVIVRLLSEED